MPVLSCTLIKVQSVFDIQAAVSLQLIALRSVLSCQLAGLLQSLRSHWALRNGTIHKSHSAPHKSAKFTLLERTEEWFCWKLPAKRKKFFFKSRALLHGGEEEGGMLPDPQQHKPAAAPLQS